MCKYICDVVPIIYNFLLDGRDVDILTRTVNAKKQTGQTNRVSASEGEDHKKIHIIIEMNRLYFLF